MSAREARPLPKFGEWDVNDPSSADGFTVIFNKARDEKKMGIASASNRFPDKLKCSQGKDKSHFSSKRKWFCCILA